MNPAFMRALPQGLGIESGRELGYYMGLRDSLAPEVVAQSAILSAPDLPFTMCKKWASAEPWTPLVGFANSPLWLIVLAFMLSACMKKSGLAKRLGLLVVSNFAGSVLQLGYCVAVCEVLFGALIPSNTARGAGIILPILLPLLKETLDSDPEKGTERRAGTYLVLLEMALNNKLSQVFPTASANSALIMSYARDMGESIDYMQWVRDLSVHMLLQILLCPLVLYLLYRPTADDDESTTTDGAAEKAGDVEEGGAASGEQKQMNKLKAAAAQKLGEMGPLCRDEIVTMGTLLVTIFLWAAHGAG
jgi:anion transporter